MREIRGYVCIAAVDECSFTLFGQNCEGTEPPYKNIETNGFTPYKTRAEAQKGKTALSARRDVSKVHIGRLEMSIADAHELERLARVSSLVVIMHLDGWSRLLGSYVRGNTSAYPLYGAYCCDTNFATFTSFDKAQEAGAEASRQGGCQVQLARFKLRMQTS